MSGAIVKRMLIFSCLMLLLSAPYIFADDPSSALETQEDRESYSIGYQVGQSMKTDGVEVNVDKLVQGLRDSVDGKEPLLSMEEMRTLIVNLKKEAKRTQMRRIQEQIVKNAEESEQFLNENGKREGIKTTESGLQYKVLREGDGPTPTLKDFVKVQYRGTFTDGTEFDSSFSRGEPQVIQTDGVIKGWTEALQMMKVGSKWQLFIPPDLAYGRGGLGNRIPPNKVLVFELELLAIEQEAKGNANKE